VGVRHPLTLAVSLALLTPAPAAGSTLDVRNAPGSGAQITYTAAAGEANALTVEREGQSIRVRDPGATIQFAGDCQASGADVVCLAAGTPSNATIDLADGNDSLEWRIGYALVSGGPGDDRLAAPGGRVDGGPGADEIEAQTVSYEQRTAGVRATLDGAADDGEPGEGDNLKGAPVQIEGGAGGDLLAASAGDGSAPGSATVNLVGNGGGDRLLGGPGSNIIHGGPGDDEVEGAAGDDELSGGAGADLIRGGGGTDQTSYADSPAGVTVTVGAGADDGAPGEGDDVADRKSVV
jgi:Ca2+-binding RTX toxin-like protein